MEQKIRRLKKHGVTLDDISKKQNEELNKAIRDLDSLVTKLNKKNEAQRETHK